MLEQIELALSTEEIEAKNAESGDQFSPGGAGVGNEPLWFSVGVIFQLRGGGRGAH